MLLHVNNAVMNTFERISLQQESTFLRQLHRHDIARWQETDIVNVVFYHCQICLQMALTTIFIWSRSLMLSDFIFYFSKNYKMVLDYFNLDSLITSRMESSQLSHLFIGQQGFSFHSILITFRGMKFPCLSPVTLLKISREAQGPPCLLKIWCLSYVMSQLSFKTLSKFS